MTKLSKLALISSILVFTSVLHAQILIEEGGQPVGRSSVSQSSWNFGGSSYLSTSDLRRDRRAGVGLGLGGKLGLAGANIELNFTQEHSVVVGFGAGDPFQSFSADWKYTFAGRYFSPYLSAGYARWYNSSQLEEGIVEPTPNFLTSKLLTPEELAGGQFALDFLTPSFGIQYHQLTGPYRGLSVYAEVVVLTDLRRLEPTPTGAVGTYYYF